MLFTARLFTRGYLKNFWIFTGRNFFGRPSEAWGQALASPPAFAVAIASRYSKNISFMFFADILYVPKVVWPKNRASPSKVTATVSPLLRTTWASTPPPPASATLVTFLTFSKGIVITPLPLSALKNVFPSQLTFAHFVAMSWSSITVALKLTAGDGETR